MPTKTRPPTSRTLQVCMPGGGTTVTGSGVVKVILELEEEDELEDEDDLADDEDEREEGDELEDDEVEKDEDDELDDEDDGEEVVEDDEEDRERSVVTGMLRDERDDRPAV